MTKKKNSELDAETIDLDGAEVREQESPPIAEPALEHPNVEELLKGPKTRETGGRGTGGRPWVYSKTKDDGSGKEPELRQPRQGDQNRPQCPYCTNDQVAVLCGAKSSRTLVTHYKCPRPLCTFSATVTRPGFQEHMAGQIPKRPFVERP